MTLLNPQRLLTPEETAHVLPQHAQCGMFPCFRGSYINICTGKLSKHACRDVCVILVTYCIYVPDILIPSKDIGKHTDSSITPLSISSKMMTGVASLAPLSCCWLSSSPLCVCVRVKSVKETEIPIMSCTTHQLLPTWSHHLQICAYTKVSSG